MKEEKTLKAPILSICIPNYNRPNLLWRNLEVLAMQADPSFVEIVVSDDASKENISSIIKKFKKTYPKSRFSFHQQKVNLGHDKHVLKLVSYAKGDYCWLLSNDDEIIPQSVRNITKVIQKFKPASILINYSRFDHLSNSITANAMINDKKSRLFTNPNNFFFSPIKKSYFKFLGVNTITISCNIFKRDLWTKSARSVKNYLGHNFIHVFVITKMIMKSKRIYYMSKPQVQYRANNHRVWGNDIWKDYNNILLSYMKKLGYNEKKIKELYDKQQEYVIREAATKSPLISNTYRLALKTAYKIKKLLGI